MKNESSKTTGRGAEPRPPIQGAERGAGLRRLFDSLRADERETIARDALLEALTAAGLERVDPRIAETVRTLDGRGTDEGLCFEDFADAVQPSRVVVDRVLGGRAAIPDFADFADELRRIFASVEGREDGRVADYIPQLGRVDPSRFGVSLCTVDGQRLDLGDCSEDFSVQSCCKPISYCLALEEHGAEHVHRHIGREPSGVSFNELALNPEGLPHNPMINAGAIMSSALIRPELSASDRFDHVIDTWRRLSGGSKPGFSNSTYLSERGTADRNFALGYSMRESGAFPPGTNLVETLEFYIQCCSMEITARSLALVAATFAGGGVCPTTGERVLQPDTVRKCLSLMSSCGMYDFSGEWAFSVGLPAKSGVSGAIWVVVPNLLGLCIWSPRLDGLGNSVRGVEFCKELVRTFNFHHFDNLVGPTGTKLDPRKSRVARKADDVGTLCWAASEGDVGSLRQMIARGVSPSAADYDGRTALHLAAAEGRLAALHYLLGLGVERNPRDRWTHTPLDDARRGGHVEAAALLEGAGARRGGSQKKAG